MRSFQRWIGLMCLVLNCGSAGCTRSSPPEVPVYHPPAKRVVKEITTPEPAADAPRTVVVEQAPPPPPELKVVATKPAPVVEAPPEPKQEAPKEPTLIGSWRVTEMAQKGMTMPMPAGMEMTLTFAEGGTVSMSMSGGPGPEGQNRQGTYTYADGQLTISMDRETKTGKCTFEGNDRITIEIDEMRMTLTRA